MPALGEVGAGSFEAPAHAGSLRGYSKEKPFQLDVVVDVVAVGDLCGDADVTVVNEPEASSLTDLEVATPEQAVRAAAKLAENGHRLVIVTLGANGSGAFESGEAPHYPAPAIRAVDTTAAGDSFCGALAVALVEGKGTAEAVRFATAASALCAMSAGAMPSIPEREALECMCAESCF